MHTYDAYSGMSTHLTTPVSRMGSYREAPRSERNYGAKTPAINPMKDDAYMRVLMLSVGVMSVARVFRLADQVLPAIAASLVIATALSPHVSYYTAQMGLGFGIGVFMTQSRTPTEQMLGGGVGMLLLNAPEVLGMMQ